VLLELSTNRDVLHTKAVTSSVGRRPRKINLILVKRKYVPLGWSIQASTTIGPTVFTTTTVFLFTLATFFTSASWPVRNQPDFMVKTSRWPAHSTVPSLKIIAIPPIELHKVSIFSTGSSDKDEGYIFS
jgi:hypothetical protein